MKLDKYKQAIADEYIKTRNNIFVSATAGSGKTTLLVHLMGLTPPNKKPLFTAFNKSIAEELKNRVPSTVKVGTIHSLAMGVIRAKYNCNFEVKELKEFIVAKECLRLSHMPPKNRNAYIFEVCEVYNLCLLNLVEDTERFKEICDQYGYLYSERLEKDAFTLKKENTRRFKEMKPFQKVLISFTDMLWVANTFVEQKYWNKYDVLFMDEIQDFNPLHKEIAFKFLKKGGRFVAVGDNQQCQPEGTKVLLSDKSFKNIEDIQVGDRVVTYNSSASRFMGYKFSNRNVIVGKRVLKKSERFVDKTIKIVTKNNNSSEYSFNHHCYIRYNREECKNSWVLYLMVNGKGMYRIGKTKLFNSNSSSTNFGLQFRMQNEKCVKAWILKISHDEKEILKDEIYYSYKFGIPQLVFQQERAGSQLFSDKDIEDIYSSLGNLESKAIKLLNYFNKDINYPICTNNCAEKHSREYCSIIAACNLFPKYMQVIEFDPKNQRGKYVNQGRNIQIAATYVDIKKVKVLKGKKKVFSLEVEKDHNYVADGILTHNCIYSFQGSNLNSFNAIKSIPNTVSLPLSVTYRCAENIVNEALTVFEDGIEAAAGAAKGIVYYGDYMDAKPGDFILCRNNFPLFTAFTYLLQANKKAHIIGKDFEEGLCKLVEQINYISDLDEIRDEKLEKLRERGVTRPEFHPAYVQYMELYNIIKFLYRIFGSLDKVLRTIRNAFNSNNGGIKLSTIHKAKGLEADRVFFLDPELIPSPYALTELEQYNERCLEFVAITRAKKELVYCHSF